MRKIIIIISSLVVVTLSIYNIIVIDRHTFRSIGSVESIDTVSIQEYGNNVYLYKCNICYRSLADTIKNKELHFIKTNDGYQSVWALRELEEGLSKQEYKRLVDFKRYCYNHSSDYLVYEHMEQMNFKSLYVYGDTGAFKFGIGIIMVFWLIFAYALWIKPYNKFTL